MDSDLTQRIEAGLAAVKNRVAFFGDQFGRSRSSWKHDGTRVTDADLAISRTLFAELREAFPHDDFCSEESDANAGPQPLRSRFAWILDPIDGTNNYALGIPVTAISLALLENGTPVCGFVYDFGRRCLFHGGPGLGLYADGQPTEAVRAAHNDTPIVAMHSPIAAQFMPVINAVLEHYKLRAYGSGALHLTYTALGMIDLCLDYTVKVWDIAAAYAFCRETGVDVVFFQESPFPLRTFDVRMKSVQYLAGLPDKVAEIKTKVSGLQAAARR